jgi:hypothetical protein
MYGEAQEAVQHQHAHVHLMAWGAVGLVLWMLLHANVAAAHLPNPSPVHIAQQRASRAGCQLS